MSTHAGIHPRRMSRLLLPPSQMTCAHSVTPLLRIYSQNQLNEVHPAPYILGCVQDHGYPCRHLVAHRLAHVEPMISMKDIAERWLIKVPSTVAAISAPQVPAPNVQSSKQQFHELQVVFKRIANLTTSKSLYTMVYNDLLAIEKKIGGNADAETNNSTKLTKDAAASVKMSVEASQPSSNFIHVDHKKASQKKKKNKYWHFKRCFHSSP